MINKIILQGRMVRDAELRSTVEGISVARFVIASERTHAGKDGVREADFIPCVAFRGLAEHVARYFPKGKMLILEGSLRVQGYETSEGERRTSYEVLADAVHFAGGKATKEETKEEDLFTMDELP